MKKAVAILLFLALVTCAFSGCVEKEFTPNPKPTLTPTFPSRATYDKIVNIMGNKAS